MKLIWNKDNERGVMTWTKGEYSEWRLIEQNPATRNGTDTVYILVRIMGNTEGNKEGVQVGELYDRMTAHLIAQLIEDGKAVEYPKEPVEQSDGNSGSPN